MKKLFMLILFLIPLSFSKGENIAENILYDSKIWFSKPVTFSGETVRIYSEFKNDEKFDIENVIEFYDNKKLIGSKKISIASGRKSVLWIDYILEYGNHKIIAKIKDKYKDEISKEKKEKVIINENPNLKIIEIDNDTDKDGIGDKKDHDDDNDGYSDEEELKNGSNPKSKLSTPQIEETKKIIKKTTESTKNITSNLLEILNEKRESIKNQLETVIKKSNDENIKKEKKKIIDLNSYNIKSELSLIKKESAKKEFQSKKDTKKDIFKKSIKISDVIKTSKEELEKINNQKLSKKERDFSKACLFQAKYEKIKEISEKENSPSWWKTMWLYIIIFLSFIFKSNILTIIFFILLFWLLWKIIKRF